MDNRASLIARILDDYRRTGVLHGFTGGDGTDENAGDGDNQHTDNAGHNANSGGQQEGGTQGGGQSGFQPITSQNDLNKIVSDRIKREKDALTQRIKDELTAAARAEEAKAQGDFKKLLDELQPKHEQLERDHETATTELTALRSYFDADYKAALKDLPEAITALAPEATEPFTVRSAWLTKAREAAKKLGTTTPRGNGPNPPPGGSGVNDKDAIARTAQRARM